MSSYGVFAEYYDVLTQNVDYAGYADYLCEILQRYQHDPGLTLDLACGTGSLTLALSDKGLDVFGADGSVDMLSVAQQKAAEKDRQILFLCQKMQALDLYSSVDTVFCVLDSLNHMTNSNHVQKAMERVSLFLEPGGFFIFDVNTVYKHQEILANNTYVYDMEEVYCVWQNQYEGKPDHLVDISLDFFAREGDVYHRSSEQFQERAYPREQLEQMLNQAGLETVAVFDEFSFDPPKADSQRLVFVTRKPM